MSVSSRSDARGVMQRSSRSGHANGVLRSCDGTLSGVADVSDPAEAEYPDFAPRGPFLIGVVRRPAGGQRIPQPGALLPLYQRRLSLKLLVLPGDRAAGLG